MDRCLAGEQVTFEFWWDSPRRGRRHVNARYDPFYDSNGPVSGVVADIRETTDRKRIEQQLAQSAAALEKANREMESFSDALTHDMRSAALIVTNFSHNLHGSSSLSGQQRDDLQRISHAGLHMLHIVDDLRDFTYVNRRKISRGKIDLSALGRDIMDDLRERVPDREVRFVAAPRIKAHGDPTLVRTLLTNLLQNAWKYTGSSPDAWIELGVVEDEGGAPIYHVRDNGIGFDNADGEKIFQAFVRLHTSAEFSGSGLGLAIVERIVRRHGGRVWANGVLGGGAVVRFTLGSSGAASP